MAVRKRVTAGGLVKYHDNPFLNSDEINVRNKQVRISVSSGENHNVLLNTDTGEFAHTHVVSYRKVDDEEFVKLFTANIALTFNLSMAGRKTFDLLLRVIQKASIGKDKVYLSDDIREDVLEEFPKLKLSKATFHRGLKDLEENKIIARSVNTNVYFINPHLIFNGDRVAFTNAIERRGSTNDKEIE
jgi:hypothetical protein